MTSCTSLENSSTGKTVPDGESDIRGFFEGCDLYDPNPYQRVMLEQIRTEIHRKLDEGEPLDTEETWLEGVMDKLDNAASGGDFIESAIIREDGTLEISEYFS